MTELLTKTPTRLLARLEEANKKPMIRTIEFEAKAHSINEEERTVELAFSSDRPYLRWDGFEILGHEPDEIDLGRLNNKAPLLWMHIWEKQLGVIESVVINTKEGVGRATVRFGKGKLAKRKFDDVVDSILTKVSVGYMVLEWRDVSEEGAEIPSYRVVWEPFEISMVTIAADDDVGVAKTLSRFPENGEKIKDKNINIKPRKKEPEMDAELELKAKEAAKEAADKAASQSRQTESDRQRDIRATAKNYGISNEISEPFLADSTKTPAQFIEKTLELVQERSNGGKDKDGNLKDVKKFKGMDDPNIGMDQKDVDKFSFVRLIRALSNPNTKAAQNAAALELEACEAAASKKNGDDSDVRGMTIPFDVLCAPVTKAMGQRIMHVAQRIVSTTTPVGGPGANLIATDLLSGSFIDLLTNRTTAMQLGFILSGLVGNVDIPRQSGGGTGFWLGEDATVTESDQEYDQISLTPKTCGARTQVTRKMLQQSSLDIEALTRFDIARTLALLIDLAFYEGTAAGNQPRGITNQVGINTVDFTALNPTYLEIIDMETQIAADNADVSSMAYVMPATMRGHLKGTQKFSGTNGNPVWEPMNQVNGYRTEVTNQILVNEIVFGNFSDALIGLWGGLDMIVDPYSDSNRGRINITSFQDVDFAVRHVESFCHGKQFTP